MKIREIVLSSILLVSLISCHGVATYREDLAQVAKSIHDSPTHREELIEAFELKGTKSVVTPLIQRDAIEADPVYYTETWRLDHGYNLIAIAAENPEVSQKSEAEAIKWQETASERDFFVLEVEPIKQFRSFRILSPRGNPLPF